MEFGLLFASYQADTSPFGSRREQNIFLYGLIRVEK